MSNYPKQPGDRHKAKTVTAIRLTSDERDQLREAAARQGQTIHKFATEAVRRAIREALNRPPTQEPPVRE